MYIYKSVQGNVVPKVSMSLASVATIATFEVLNQSDVFSLNALILTAPTVTATVLTFINNPTPGSSVGAITLGTLTIPVGSAIGKVVRHNIKPISVLLGSEIVINVTTASTAGAAQAFLVFDEDPESDSNSVNLINVLV